MIEEDIVINRNRVYLTIDHVRIETNNGIEEKNDQFVVFVKNTAPNAVNFGEQVKDSEGRNIVFNSIQEAKDYTIEKLKKSIYPPDFYHPLRYTNENLSEITHKVLLFDIGPANKNEITETISGRIVGCFLAANSPNLPAIARIVTSSGERNLDFFEIKNIRRG